MSTRRLNALVLALFGLIVAGMWAMVWSDGERLLTVRVSEFNGEVRVTEDGHGVRRLRFTDRSVQTAMRVDLPCELVSPYFRSVAAAIETLPVRAPDSALIVGMGGGALTRFYSECRVIPRLVSVELDPVVVDVAEQYFGVDRERVSVVVGDGGQYVRAARESFDVIVLDAFAATGYPPGLITSEFFQSVADLLSEDGSVIANVLGRSHNAQYAAMLASFRRVFSVVELHDVCERDQVILVAREPRVDRRGRFLDARRSTSEVVRMHDESTRAGQE